MIRFSDEMFESGSTARNATVRISNARHFFWESRLLDRKMSSAQKKKERRMCSTCEFQADEKNATTQQCRAVETQFFATVKYKSSIFFRDDKIFICCTCS